MHVLCHVLLHLHLFVFESHLFFHGGVPLHLLVSLHCCLHHHLLIERACLHQLLLAGLRISHRPLELFLRPGFDGVDLLLLVQESLYFHVGRYEALELSGKLLIGLSEAAHVLLKGFDLNL